MRTLHFLHIRKTGGTAIKHALRCEVLPADLCIVLHEHHVRLRDIPRGEQVFFFLRDPVARFVSGFNSRWREGRPRYHHPWNAAERAAFERFPAPDALAAALVSGDERIREEAANAMRGIRHVSSHLTDQLGDERYLTDRRDDLFFIGRQETLSIDFARLRMALGLGDHILLPQDEGLSHRSPRGMSTCLSVEALTALRGW